jgi:hypothetical protein
MREVEMLDRTIRKKRLIETVETVFEVHASRSSTSLKRGVNERKILRQHGAQESGLADAFAGRNVGATKNLPRVFLRKKPGANHQKPNQPKKLERTPTRPLNHE